ncbi:MAG: thioredoxin family protein [Ignavibacteria bacterium]|nr:thioredoxin family protein [Ignavibacteria bacterium]
MRIFLFLSLLLFFVGCNKTDKPAEINETKKQQSKEISPSGGQLKIIFYELGSTTCIPCRQMKPIMESIQKKYADQIEVIFIDVNKDPEKAKSFGIRLIPTQVFVDKEGKELHRHEGYYPEEEIDNFLQSVGLKTLN